MSEVPGALRDVLIDRYRIVSELGRGGSAIVYLADDLKHDRQVALKVFRDEVAQIMGRDRFLEEIRTTARLEHPHILSLHDSGEAAGHLFYVMPYVKDESLRERIDRLGQLPIDRAVQITKEVAGALEFAHSLGVIHRDVKPANILLPGGHAMLADFGISKALDEVRGGRTEVGLSIGTAEYMSPEQAAGDEVVDMRSDIYSLGAVLYEMLVGRPPFQGTTTQVVLGQILTMRPTRPRDVRETIPDALDGAVMRALSRLPADRFSSVEHFANALVTLDRRQGGREVRRRSPLPWVGAAVVVAAVGWAAWTTVGGGAGGSNTLPVPRVSPYVTGSAIQKEPAWSPTGNLVAYASDEAGNDDIWLSDPAGTNPLNLTADWAGNDVHPAWSPDGQRVAFISDRDGGGLYSMSALGGGLRKLADVVFDGGTSSHWIPIQWAEDGSLVFTSRDEAGTPQVYRLLDGATNEDCLTCGLGAGGGHSGHLLPGGEHLVFRSTHGPEPAGMLYLAELSTGEVREIGRDAALPTWNPLLGRLFFVSNLDGVGDLWALELNTRSWSPVGEAQRVTSGIKPSGLAVGPEGDILIARQETSSSLWSFPLSGVGVRSMEEGSRLTEVDDFNDASARWMPGGSQVVFESDRRGAPDVWLLDVTGGDTTRLTSDPQPDVGPSPSPDGSWIAYQRVSENGAELRLAPTDGSGESVPDSTWATRFTDQCCVSWSPDGTRLLITVAESGAGRSLAAADIEPATGRASALQMLDLPGVAQRGRFSPDGRSIAYEARGEGSWDLWIVDEDGTNPRRITTGPTQERQVAWAPDGRALFYIDDLQDVWTVRLNADREAEGEPQLWFDVPARYGAGEGGLDILGDRVLMAIEAFAEDIWLVTFPREPGGE